MDEGEKIQPELSEQEIRDILTNKFKLKIIDPSPKLFEQIPNKFDYELFKSLGINKEEADEYIEEIIDFFRLPIITDNFGKDHDSRRIFRRNIFKNEGDAVGYFLINNKLRGNKSLIIIKMLENTIEAIDKSKATITEADKIRELYEKFIEVSNDDNFNNLLLEEKIRIVRQFDEILIKYLNLFQKS